MRKRRIHRTGPLQAGFRVQRANGKSRSRLTVQGANTAWTGVRAVGCPWGKRLRHRSRFSLYGAADFCGTFFVGRVFWGPPKPNGSRRGRMTAARRNTETIRRSGGSADIVGVPNKTDRDGTVFLRGCLAEVHPLENDASFVSEETAGTVDARFPERDGGLRVTAPQGFPDFYGSVSGLSLRGGTLRSRPIDRLWGRLLSQPIDVLSETCVVVLPGRLLPSRTDFLRGWSGYAVCGRESCGRIRKPSLETAVHRKMRMLAAGRSAFSRMERRTGRYDMLSVIR